MYTILAVFYGTPQVLKINQANFQTVHCLVYEAQSDTHTPIERVIITDA